MVLDFKKNYFSAFDISPEFNIPLKQVSTLHLKLQSMLHPDRYATATAAERRMAAQKAAYVNEAYRVLCDDCARANYLLQLVDIDINTETETTNDVETLTQQMELREQLEETNEPGEIQKLREHAEEQRTKRGIDFSKSYQEENFIEAKRCLVGMQFFHKLAQEANNKMRDIEHKQ